MPEALCPQELYVEKHVSRPSFKLIKEAEIKWLTKANSWVLFSVIFSPFLHAEDGGKMFFFLNLNLRNSYVLPLLNISMEQLL